MPECAHPQLAVLEPKSSDRVRCRHCHLTIAATEIGGDPCPECLEVTGKHRREFEPVAAEVVTVRYRCDVCGAMMD